jgi:hypothetical protein
MNLVQSNHLIKFIIIVVLGVILLIHFSGCEHSLEKRIENTRKNADYITKDAKENPEIIMLQYVADKQNKALDEIQKKKNPLTKPYLSAIALLQRSKKPDKVDDVDTYGIYTEWFEKRFIPHSVQFKNTETSDIWTYNFQHDVDNKLNSMSAKNIVRYIQEYRFGIQNEGGKLISVEDGMKLVELAKANKLTAVLVKKDGTPISNEIIVDFVDVTRPTQPTKVEKP